MKKRISKNSQGAIKMLNPSPLSDVIFAWMDPGGIIYPVERGIHSTWIKENVDILNEYYKLNINDEIHLNKHLLKNGWVRIRNSGYFCFFEVFDFCIRGLRNIEEALFSAFSFDKDLEVIICKEVDKKCSIFMWKDFIEDNDCSFSDFVIVNVERSLRNAKKNYSWNNINWYKVANQNNASASEIFAPTMMQE